MNVNEPQMCIAVTYNLEKKNMIFAYVVYFIIPSIWAQDLGPKLLLLKIICYILYVIMRGIWPQDPGVNLNHYFS